MVWVADCVQGVQVVLKEIWLDLFIGDLLVGADLGFIDGDVELVVLEDI